MTLVLQAKKRDIIKASLNQVRQQGFVPSELYGHGIENEHVLVPKNDFLKLFKKTGENQVLQLQIEGEHQPRNVLVHELQRNSRSNEIVHVDFYQVRMDEKITADIPIKFIGKSEAVETLGGSLVKNLHAVKVKALPGNLPAEIIIDISVLKTFEDHIFVNNLQLESGVEILESKDEVIASAVPVKIEAEAPAAVSESEAIEKIQVAKKEGKPIVEETAVQEEKK